METKSINSRNINVRQKLNFLDGSYDCGNSSQNGSVRHDTVITGTKICEIQEGAEEESSFSGSYCDQKLLAENATEVDASLKKQSGMCNKSTKLIDVDTGII